MGTGIYICGLNGCGKSTLGIALATEIDFHFIDVESLFFSKTDESKPYANPKSREQVEQLLLKEVYEHNDFVFASVNGDYGKEMIPMYKYVILVEVPREIRLQRIRKRSFEKFGNRMLAGGDLYEQEESFFQMVESRQENYIESWLQTINCPIIKVDGTKSIEENVQYIINQINI